MWIWETDGGEKLYFIQGEWTIGRGSCSYTIKGDPSISRRHAKVFVGAIPILKDVNSLPTMSLSDTNSKFGTFVNEKKVDPNESDIILKNGDRVRVGVSCVFLVKHYPLVGVPSRIRKAAKVVLYQNAKNIGMHILDKPSEDVTHCITEPGQSVPTVKLLWALVFGQPIISTEWLQAVVDRQSLETPLPTSFTIEVPEEPNLYAPNPKRKTLFSMWHVVFLQPHDVEPMIAFMGGISLSAYETTKEDMVKRIKALQTHRTLVVKPSSGHNDGMLQAAIRAGCHPIDEGDLAGSIVYLKNPSTFAPEVHQENHEDSEPESPEVVITQGPPRRRPMSPLNLSQKRKAPAQHVESEELQEVVKPAKKIQKKSSPVSSRRPEKTVKSMSSGEWHSRSRVAPDTTPRDSIIQDEENAVAVVEKEENHTPIYDPLPVIDCELLAPNVLNLPPRPQDAVGSCVKRFRKLNRNISSIPITQFIDYSRMVPENVPESAELRALESAQAEAVKQARVHDDMFAMRERGLVKSRIKR